MSTPHAFNSVTDIPQDFGSAAMEPCPCGRPELGRHEKWGASWLCRAGYLEKEIGYALSELERGGDWPAAGIGRLKRLVGIEEAAAQ